MDIPDIECIVQFGVPHSLSVLNQRAGRAGRSGQHVLAVVLAEPSVFQTIKKRKKQEGENKVKTQGGDRASDALQVIKTKSDEDEDLDLANLQSLVLDDDGTQIEHKKKLEAGLQAWCLVDRCRVDVSDKYFNNPPRSSMSILIFLSATYQCFRHNTIHIPML